MSGSRAPLIVAVVIGGAGLLAASMAAILVAVWFLVPHPGIEELASGVPDAPVEEPERLPEPEPDPEPDPEPVLEPEPEAETPLEVTSVEEADASPTSLEPAAQKSECKPDSRGITQLGPRKWRVKRSIIEKYTSSSDAASRLARVKWAKTKSGKTRGVRLLRVPCKSPLKAAGMRSKDLILEVDGKSVTSYAQGLRVWAAIRRKSAFTVKIKRGGSTLTHRYILSK